MYLASGTTGDSIANILPDNIWVRLALYMGILLVLFTIVSLPQIISEARQKKAAAVQNTNTQDNTKNSDKN
jgi:hypothetical protein